MAVKLGAPTVFDSANLTVRAAGNVWSYPNLHGDTAVTATQAGTKIGTTANYDSGGNQTSGTVADNAAGNFDNRWLGQYQRPTETEPGLQPIIEMGARQYSPRIGRFLQTDPITGGSANAYAYVFGDPANVNDLTGKCPECGFLALISAYYANGDPMFKPALANTSEMLRALPVSEKVRSASDWSYSPITQHPSPNSDAYPGWVRFTVKATTAVLTGSLTVAACAATAGIGCPFAFVMGAVALGTVSYVIDNPGNLSWGGWIQSLNPMNALYSWTRWPPW